VTNGRHAPGAMVITEDGRRLSTTVNVAVRT
jgi:hypothetical protein